MKKYGIAALSAIFLLTTACNKDDMPSKYDNVVILYSDGYNNLTNNIRYNVETICEGAIPTKSENKALLWVAHNAVSSMDFSTPVSPVIIRITSGTDGTAVLDTIKTLELTDRLVDKEIMTGALTFIRKEFESDHYGIVFSSHGTGWLPEQYYTKPTIPRVGAYLVKSFGQSYEGKSSGIKYSHELEIPDMAQAIPIHFDYIIFDACLMGGIEVAYELRSCADIIGFSQAEILSTGFDYSTFIQRLLIDRDPIAFCRDYYLLYENGKASSRSATVSVIKTGELDHLAEVCGNIFEKYRSGLDAVDPGKVQSFFSGEKHWFYDLEDFIVKAGISESDHNALKEAIKTCVVYEAHTAKILGRLDINTSCGLSSFIPSNGTTKLREYYKTLTWNKSTGLVK